MVRFIFSMTLLSIFYVSYNPLISSVQFNDFSTVFVFTILHVRLSSYMSFEAFSPLSKIPHAHLLPTHVPWALTQGKNCLLSVTRALPFLDISHKWYHTTRGLLCLLSYRVIHIFIESTEVFIDA